MYDSVELFDRQTYENTAPDIFQHLSDFKDYIYQLRHIMCVQSEIDVQWSIFIPNWRVTIYQSKIIGREIRLQGRALTSPYLTVSAEGKLVFKFVDIHPISSLFITLKLKTPKYLIKCLLLTKTALTFDRIICSPTSISADWRCLPPILVLLN